MNMNRTEAFDLAVLDEITAASTAHAGFFLASKVGLFANNITPNRTTPLGDLTQCSYTGYALQGLTFTAPVIPAVGGPKLVSNTVTFRPTDALGSSTVTYGCFVTDTAGTTMYFNGRFDPAPLPLGVDTDEVKLAIEVYADGSAKAIVVA